MTRVSISGEIDGMRWAMILLCALALHSAAQDRPTIAPSLLAITTDVHSYLDQPVTVDAPIALLERKATTPTTLFFNDTFYYCFEARQGRARITLYGEKKNPSIEGLHSALLKRKDGRGWSSLTLLLRAADLGPDGLAGEILTAHRPSTPQPADM